jgi:ribosomal protein S12 methylthiotransferase accessory factor
MLDKPKFKSCFQVEVIEEGVFLLSERDYFVLEGHLYRLIAPLIDSHHTVDDIIECLEGQASDTEIYYALMLMEKKGYIIETDDSMPSEVAAFWDSFNVNSKETATRLQTTPVAVTAFVPSEQFISSLELLNVRVEEESNIRVVLTDDYLRDELDAFNQNALQLKSTWMLVKPVGTILWIGPMFQPGKTGCWECLAQRLRINRPVETFIQKQKGISTSFSTSLSILPSTFKTGVNLAATELAKWIVRGENQQLEGNLITLDTLSLEMQSHRLVRRPQCPCCGKPEDGLNKEPLPIILESRKTTFKADGGHRCFSPEETFKKYEHHISPITGVVRSLKRISDDQNPLRHSYSAGHNLASMSDSLYFLRKTLRSRSGGKGKTDIQSKVSGLCEAIERYSGVFQGNEIRKKGSKTKMGAAAIHPNDCMNFSDEQYKTRQEWNAKCAANKRVPEPFDEGLEIEWTPLWSLTNQDFKYLPTAYCYYGYPILGKPFCWANSNGNAAGNTIEEAILQGFMELVERDSVALWWYNRIKMPEVNLDSFDEPYFQALKNYYQTIHRDLWVLDLTSDLNIPTFAAISRRTDKQIEDIIFGFGAHFDPRLGILRAMTEANQILDGFLAVAPDGSTRYLDSDEPTRDWWTTARLENQSYLAPDESAAPRVSSGYSQLCSDDLRDDVITCANIVEKNGMEMLVLDQTRPDLELNVVKVVVPGMRHFWKRLGPGRLYDVPPRLGWLPEPLKENQLNPLSMFF